MGLFDDIGNIAGNVISNVIDPGGIGRKIVAESAKSAAGLFNDATAPFLGPVQNIIKTLEPGFRFDFGDINARLAVATRSEFVFPQLPGLSRSAGGGSDVTGGLLSDLAFDSEALQRSETDLGFLSSALRRGVYPHRSDAFFLGISAVPKLNGAGRFDGQAWVRAHITDVTTSNVSTEADVTVGLRDVELNEAIDSMKARTGTAAPAAVDVAAALERSTSVQLRTQRNTRKIFQIEITLQDVGAAALPNLGQFLRELSIWIERRNEGYTDVLHSFVWHEPIGNKIAILFPVDRTEYISDNADNKMQVVGRTGGGLAAAADSIDQALAEIQKPAAAPAENSKGMERLQEILAARVARAETVRGHLWEAQRKIVRLQAADNVFDYRLRYKLRLENTVNGKRTITRLRMRSTGVANADFDLGRFELPQHCRYDMTVYPLRQSPETTNEVSLEMGESRSNFTMSLVAGLGVAETVVQSIFPTGNPVDAAKLQWSVGDTAS